MPDQQNTPTPDDLSHVVTGAYVIAPVVDSAGNAAPDTIVFVEDAPAERTLRCRTEVLRAPNGVTVTLDPDDREQVELYRGKA